MEIKRYESNGILHYSPKMLGKESPNWWLVVQCDPLIGEYYRSLYNLSHHKCRRIIRPAWKEHISIIANESPVKNVNLWGIYEGYNVKFYYDPEVITNGMFYWLNVEVLGGVMSMRTELGLPAQPDPPFHLTVGHDEDYERVKKKFGFIECPFCGAGHRDKVVICRECGFKAGL